MLERFVINRDMHMGPICRNVKAGDVISFDSDLDHLDINGVNIKDDGRAKGSREGFAEVARILRTLIKKDPDNPIADLLGAKESDGMSGFAKTDTLAIVPVLGCFRAVEEWLKGKQDWTSAGSLQAHFVEHFIEYIEQIDSMGDNLEHKASAVVGEINAWLEQHDFDIQLDDLKGERDFYVASILNVIVEWLEEGEKVTISNAKGNFDAVRITNGVAAYMDTEIHDYPVIKIRTKSGDILCMSVCERLNDDKFSMYWKVQELRSIKKPHDCEGVVFPMIKYDENVDISWLNGLRTNPGDEYYRIAEALQHTKFRMNEFGAKAESGAAMAMEFCCAVFSPKPWIFIDKPFVLWIERDGIGIPLFSGTFAEDAWMNPGSLN